MSFLNLDLNLLRVFDAVMIEQNLTRAAVRLATTQPAVSNALKRLRHELHDELFIRIPHGVRPTSRAEDLQPAVRHALQTLETAIASQETDLSTIKKTFRLSMADSTASLMLPALVSRVKKVARKLNLLTLPLLTRDPRPALFRNEIDLALGYFPGVVAQLNAEQVIESTLCHCRLYSGEYVCVMRRNHPLAQGQLTLQQFCAADHILVSFSGRLQGHADKVLASLGFERNVVLTVNQFYTAAQIVEASDLLLIMPRHLIALHRMERLLVARKLPFTMPGFHIDMLWHGRDRRDFVHRWIRSTLCDITSLDARLPGNEIENEVDLA